MAGLLVVFFKKDWDFLTSRPSAVTEADKMFTIKLDESVWPYRAEGARARGAM